MSDYVVSEKWRPILEAAGLRGPEDWRTSPRVDVWRDVNERENAVLDLPEARLHVKRMKPGHADAAREELAGIDLLESVAITTTPVVAHSVSRGLLVTLDLADHVPLDQREIAGEFDIWLDPTARIAAKLHRTLHHRDLYLCHFLAKSPQQIALIDAARVRALPKLTRRRWVVKDLAQFRYSARQQHVAERDLDRWLERWAELLGTFAGGWRDAVLRKTDRIAAHDARLATTAPERDVTLPPRQVAGNSKG